MSEPDHRLSTFELGFIAVCWIPAAAFVASWWYARTHPSGIMGNLGSGIVAVVSLLAMLAFGVVGAVATCARLRDRLPAKAMGIASLVSAGPLVVYLVSDLLWR